MAFVSDSNESQAWFNFLRSLSLPDWWSWACNPGLSVPLYSVWEELFSQGNLAEVIASTLASGAWGNIATV